MTKQYNIRNFADLLRVPAERRDDCMRELQYGLALLELSFGDDAHKYGKKGFVWTDDGATRIEMMCADGTPFLTLAVEPAAAIRGASGQEGGGAR
ncbi:hypothetical protein J2X90_000745 [Variovorax paradoxus]|uniref:hypothetical protein n=1 Tax=Variovorax paradoxus TaxID=34073 RepID=UPI002784BE0F|nr:hypothetical protein [Variovorax paradoxus]MDQ0022959.1 hypothetical protein [Variovorax paradoxus]